MITVRPGNNVVFVGDSITAGGWPFGAGNAVEQLDAQMPVVRKACWGARAGGAIARASGGTAVSRTVAIQTEIIEWNSGVSGNKAADIAADVPGRITNHDPQVVVLEVGVNDVAAATPLASFQASIHTILQSVRAWSSTVQIAVLSVCWYGEHWTLVSGSPVWDNFFDAGPSNPGYTPSIPQYNAILQAECLLVGGTYVDVHAPALLYEQANNVPMPGVANGILTQDQIHPTIPLGRNFISDLFIAQTTVVP